MPPPLVPPPLTARRPVRCSVLPSIASRPCRREPPLPVTGCACTVDTTLCLSVCMLYAHVFGMASIMFMMILLSVVERATAGVVRAQ